MPDTLPRSLALVVLVALVLAVLQGLGTATGELGLRSGTVRQVAQIVVLSLAWLLCNSPVEGRVLLVIGRGHGITTGDLVVVPALLVAVALTVARARG